MKVHFLPAEQEKRNDKIVEKLRNIGLLLFLLVMATLALGAKLYIWHPASDTGPQMSGQDGQTTYSDAIVLKPDLVLTPARINGSAVFRGAGQRINASRIEGTTLPDGTELTLMRLVSPTSAEPVDVVVFQVGDQLSASRSNQEWHGAVTEKVDGGYAVEPAFSLAPGTAVYQSSDKTALAGFAFRNAAGIAVFPASEIVSRFPALRMNQ